MSVIHDEGPMIVNRMRELRSLGKSDVLQLHAQAERVTDWREHVRAQPMVTALSSTVLGYMVVRALAGAPVNNSAYDSSTSHPFVAPSSVQVAKQASITAGILSLAGGIALSVGRQWVTEYLKKQLGGITNGTNQPTHSEKRQNTPA